MGLTLYQIGKILCRSYEDENEPSILEWVVERAERNYITHAKLKYEQSTCSRGFESPMKRKLPTKEPMMDDSSSDDEEFKVFKVEYNYNGINNGWRGRSNSENEEDMFKSKTLGKMEPKLGSQISF